MNFSPFSLYYFNNNLNYPPLAPHILILIISLFGDELQLIFYISGSVPYYSTYSEGISTPTLTKLFPFSAKCITSI